MTLPAPTWSFLTKAQYDAAGTAAGGLASGTDNWGNTTYGTSDGVDDAFAFTSRLFDNGALTKYSTSCWFSAPSSGLTGGMYLLTQHGNDLNKMDWSMYLNVSTGRIAFYKGPTAANFMARQGTVDYRDSVLRHLGISWELGVTPIICINGVAVSTTDVGAGAKSDAWPGAFNETTRIYRRTSSPDYGVNLAIRHKGYADYAATEAEWLTEYNAELAAIPVPSVGGGDSGPGVFFGSPTWSKRRRRRRR